MAAKVKGINIEIGSETTQFKKGLAELSKASNGLQTELSAVNKGLKFDPKNTELLRQKQELLTQSVAETKNKLDVLKQAKEKADADMANGTEINEKQYRELERAISATDTKLGKLTDQTKEFGTVAQQELKQVGKKFEEVGEKTTDVGKKMSKGITAPILAIGAAAQVAFNEVDTALDTIITKTGASGEVADDLNASFREVYKSLPVDAQAAGDAIGEVNTQFALTGEELEAASKQILKFAEINGQDVTSSTTMSKGAMEAFGLSADDLNSSLDAITKTAQNTGVGTDKIFDSVTKGAPQLKALGLNFAQSAEVMGRFEQKGLDSGKALSYMSKAQVTFAKEGKTLSEGMDELTEGIQNSSSETESLALSAEYFGTKGASFMLDAIQRGALDFGDFANAAESASGSVSSTFDATLDPVDNFKTAMNNLKLVGTDLSATAQEALLPILEGLVEKLKSFSEWFNNLNPKLKEGIVITALVAAAIGPVIVVLGTLITSIGTIMTLAPALSAAFAGVKVAIAAIGGPVTIIIAIIGALIAYFVHLYKTNEDFRDKVNAVWASIKTVFIGTLKAIISFFSGAVATFKDVGVNLIKGLWNGIASVKAWIYGKIKGFVNGITSVVKAFFGIHSPSLVFQEIGKFLVEGLAIGISENASFAADEMEKLCTMIVGQADEIATGILEKDAKTGQLVMNSTYKNIEEKIKLYYKDRDTRISTMDKASRENIKTLQKDIKATENATKAQIEMFKAVAQAKSQSIDDETDEVVNGLQSQLDAIDKAEEQRNREKDSKEYDTKLSGLYDKLNETSGDENLKVVSDIEQLKSDRKETLRKQDLSDEKDSIREKMDEARKEANKKKKLLEEELKQKTYNLEQQRNKEIEHMNKVIELMQIQVDKKAELEKIQIEIKDKEKKLQTKNIDKETKEQTKNDLSELKEQEKNLKKSLSEDERNLKDFTPTIEGISRGYGDVMLSGFKSTEGNILSYVDSLCDEIRSRIKAASGDGGSDGSHRTGLDYVPFDNYSAALHKGEMVLTQPKADRYRKNESVSQNNSKGDFIINIEKVENKNNRSVSDFLKEAEFYRKSKQLAVGGV